MRTACTYSTQTPMIGHSPKKDSGTCDSEGTEKKIHYANIKQSYAPIHPNLSASFQVLPFNLFSTASCSPFGFSLWFHSTIDTVDPEEQPLSFCPVVQLCHCLILLPIWLWLITLPVIGVPFFPSIPSLLYHGIQMTVWCRGTRQWDPDVWSMEDRQRS